MPIYSYVGKDILGRKRKGKVEADNLELAENIVRSRGIIYIESLKEDKSIFNTELKVPISFGKKIKGQDILIFTRQLYAMVQAGISLVAALKVIKEQVTNPELKNIVEDLASHIEEGGRFSTALSKYRDVFGDLYISMIRAAEEAGTLDTTLGRLADYIEKIEKLKGKIKSAMFYPVFTLIIATVIVVGILVFVIPTFKNLYASLGGQLPALTQMIIKASDFLRNYVGWGIVGLVVFIIIFKRLRRIEKIKFFLDQLILRVPIFGELVLKSSVANFSTTLSSMIASGINILDALDIAIDTSTNEVVKKAIRNVRDQVERGVSLSIALARNKIFPPMLINMVAIGEEAGTLDEMLAKVAEFYEEEVDRTVDGLTSLIEPMMMLFIGGIIGFIIVAMYLPIFKMGELMK
ncbi:MAG: type II secretion system F family protein [Desulfurobacteriaceae bacterium]